VVEPVVEPVVEAIAEPVEVIIYDPVPEPVPSIDIEEWERQQAEAAALLEPAIVEEAPAPVAAPRIRKSALERAQAAKTPDAMIAILKTAEDSEEKQLLMKKAYESKLTSDKASGNAQGEAEALVYLAKLEAGKNVAQAGRDIFCRARFRTRCVALGNCFIDRPRQFSGAKLVSASN